MYDVAVIQVHTNSVIAQTSPYPSGTIPDTGAQLRKINSNLWIVVAYMNIEFVSRQPSETDIYRAEVRTSAAPIGTGDLKQLPIFWKLILCGLNRNTTHSCFRWNFECVPGLSKWTCVRSSFNYSHSPANSLPENELSLGPIILVSDDIHCLRTLLINCVQGC